MIKNIIKKLAYYFLDSNELSTLVYRKDYFEESKRRKEFREYKEKYQEEWDKMSDKEKEIIYSEGCFTAHKLGEGCTFIDREMYKDEEGYYRIRVKKDTKESKDK